MVKRHAQPRALQPDQNGSVPFSLPDSSLAPLRGANVLYFDLFRHEVVHDLAGIGYHELWTTTILYEALQDECIRHSVLALGALSLALEEDGAEGLLPLVNLSRNSAIKQHYSDALRHHGKALHIFSQAIEDRWSSRFIFLATVALAAFEVLHGSGAAVGRLILHSQNLLKQCVMQSQKVSLPTPPLKAESPGTSVYFVGGNEAYPSDGNTTGGTLSVADISAIDTDVARPEDAVLLVPRLTMIHGLIPLLPITQRLCILGTLGFSAAHPTISTDMQTLFRMWREYCTVVHRLTAYMKWADGKKDVGTDAGMETELDTDQREDAHAALERLYECSRAWETVIEHHLAQQRLLTTKTRDFLRAMRLQRQYHAVTTCSTYLEDEVHSEMLKSILAELKKTPTDGRVAPPSRAWKRRLVADWDMVMLFRLAKSARAAEMREECEQTLARLLLSRPSAKQDLDGMEV
jgi:hypothetical protein